ncbi:hypothetical protein [Streptomyces sp. G45]|uniref:hypothetical protein n=1 Tax=Streptomyces sp. G45 TaxID=3406627 RepID=UPI003C1F0C88
MRQTRTGALPTRRHVLALGAAALAAAGAQGLAAPGAAARERPARGRDGVSDGSTFMAWRGLGGDQRVFWSGLRGTAPGPARRRCPAR